jgi:hypothetical protein
MGRMTAMEIADTQISIEQQLAWHLRGNHYPPVPTSMIKPCIEAIDAFWEYDTNRLISMPEGVLYKGSPTAPAWAVIEQHHLDSWCELSEEGHCLDCDSTHAVDMPCEDE